MADAGRGDDDAALNLLDDDDLWVGVLTGTPTVFCAGSDLTAGGDNVTERCGEYGVVRRHRRTPLIAARRSSPRSRAPRSVAAWRSCWPVTSSWRAPTPGSACRR
ncbi:hypothetical protein FRACA_1980007 [Frankia canadensis]|uniref:Uncharacterized protein n=1 Tax=Frankia canadensis TaxID=1836972 RepID=A0A2I2KPM5_9ACTN|nr:hypothetical protein FRACA_1980007 [Frankia canadensis]SOU54879.1 hypothetical protein FRACA_1980007 [Frankia canadensis]